MRLIILLLLLAYTASSQQLKTDKDGQNYLLEKDGTWSKVNVVEKEDSKVVLREDGTYIEVKESEK